MRASRGASRRPGRSTTTNWSPGTRAPRRCTACAARWARIRPSRAHSAPYPFPPVPDEPPIARRARQRMARVGLHPASLPLGVDIERLAQARGDALGRLSRRARRQDGRRDLRARRRARASQRDAANRRSRGAPDRRRPTASASRRRVSPERRAKRASSKPRLVVLSAGAVKSAAMLLRSSERGRRQPVRHGRPAFHESQSSAVLAIDPRPSTIPSIRRRCASTISISTTGGAGRRSATFSCSGASAARSSRPI